MDTIMAGDANPASAALAVSSLTATCREGRRRRMPAMLTILTEDTVLGTGDALYRPFEPGDDGLVVRRNGELGQNSLPDDPSLVGEIGEGRLLILGCCHAGLVNPRDRVRTPPLHRPIRSTHGPTRKEGAAVGMRVWDARRIPCAVG